MAKKKPDMASQLLTRVNDLETKLDNMADSIHGLGKQLAEVRGRVFGGNEEDDESDTSGDIVGYAIRDEVGGQFMWFAGLLQKEAYGKPQPTWSKNPERAVVYFVDDVKECADDDTDEIDLDNAASAAKAMMKKLQHPPGTKAKRQHLQLIEVCAEDEIGLDYTRER